MPFVDEITLELAAGNGGSGVVRWRREKFVSRRRPGVMEAANLGEVEAKPSSVYVGVI
ncbi:MAG: hypothetical protein HY420_02100 [Candidatus Kerfeldbacteria bacterium]|nr:hypothetical protein [Candidatus Kerfeldbacteria bacterium]